MKRFRHHPINIPAPGNVRVPIFGNVCVRTGLFLIVIASALVLIQPTFIHAQTPTPSENGAAAVHIVTYGDTLLNIAVRYRLTVNELAIANDMVNVNTIYVGQRLIVPARAELSDPVPTAADSETPPPPDQPTATQTPYAPPNAVNGMPLTDFIRVDEQIRAQMRATFAIGQGLNRNPRAFSKLGDSTIENPFFMDRFDNGTYNLGDYHYLQPVIDHFRGSFARDSIAVQIGLHTWSVMDSMWADPYRCTGGESILACEIRTHNPSVIFIRLGSNDVGVPTMVDRSLREIVEFCLLNGIVPIMGTKADRFDGANSPNNRIIREIATDYHLLLWDFDLIAGTIPGRGLGSDGVHMTAAYAHDWTQPAAYRTGHGIHTLTGLIALDAVSDSLNLIP